MHSQSASFREIGFTRGVANSTIRQLSPQAVWSNRSSSNGRSIVELGHPNQADFAGLEEGKPPPRQRRLERRRRGLFISRLQIGYLGHATLRSLFCQRLDKWHLTAIHFLFRASICRTSVSISAEVSLPEYLGIWPLPLVMMPCRSSVQAEAVFSEMSDGPPKWRPSAFLPWHLAQFSWKMGFAVRLESDGGFCAEIAVNVNNKEHMAMVNRKVFKLNLVRTLSPKHFRCGQRVRRCPES